VQTGAATVLLALRIGATVTFTLRDDHDKKVAKWSRAMVAVALIIGCSNEHSIREENLAGLLADKGATHRSAPPCACWPRSLPATCRF